MFVKLMFFAIETHSCSGTHAHTRGKKKLQEGGKREESELLMASTNQYKSTSGHFETFSFLFWSRTVGSPLLLEWCVLAQIAQRWHQTYAFIKSGLCGEAQQKLLNLCTKLHGPEFLRESVCRAAFLLVKTTLSKSLNGILWALETKRENSVSTSVLLGFNKNLIFFTGPGAEGPGAS